MKKIRIGSGAGYGGDRIEPAIELMEKGNIDYIIFECLAERTIAIAQEAKLKNPDRGYNGLLEYRMKKVLPLCKEKGIKVVTNMGAANPEAAVKVIKQLAMDLGIKGLKIAAVLGDDIGDQLTQYMTNEVLELKRPLSNIKDKVVSANVYLGIEGIVNALENGADIVVTGRCADPALVLAPLVHEFGWAPDAYDLRGSGILAGHLLECAGQITGGYFADPSIKDVPELWNLGFPIAEVSENGEIIITKVEGSGGMVTQATCKEQLLYEIHDPSAYVTPDGVADYTAITMKTLGKDQVLIASGKGRIRPETLKVSIGYKDSFIGEGEMSYGGSNAFAKAELAGEIIKKRLDIIGCEVDELRIDYLGYNSLYKDQIAQTLNPSHIFGEVRLRVSGRTKTREMAQLIANEVEALYTNGPSGGGGATQSVKEVVAIGSIFVPRTDIEVQVIYEEV
ncbi:acyclic terpene utilization AtuA family protein [Fusibacter bizertensis]